MQDVQTCAERPMLSRLFGVILARLLSPLASFVIIVLIARMWGRDDLGQFNTVLAWLAIFQFVSLFGMGEYISKEIGKAPSTGERYLTHGLLFGLMSSLIFALLMIGGAVLFRYPEQVRHGIMIAALGLAFSTWTLICQSVFTAYQKIKLVALASLFENFLFLLLGSAIIIKEYGLLSLIWCLVIARVLASALSLYMAHKYVARVNFQIDRAFFWKLLTPVAIFGLTGVAHQIFMRIDVIMLSKMKDMATVGLYASASKLMEICLMLPLAFYILNLPVAARGYKGFRESVQQSVEAYTGDLFVLSFFVFGFITFFARPILGHIFGEPFVAATWVLRILILAFLVHSAEMVLGMSCQAAGYHKFAMHVSSFRALANIVLNFVLIPVWAAVGAALATLLSVSLSFAIFQVFVKRTLHGIQWISIVKKPALACLFIMCLLFPLTSRLNSLLLGFVFLFGYGFFLFALNGFSVRARYILRTKPAGEMELIQNRSK